MGASIVRRHFLRPATKAPGADDVAWALVAAARATGEREALHADPNHMLRHASVTVFRWLALEALRLVWPRCLQQLACAWAMEEGYVTVTAARLRARRSCSWSAADVRTIEFELRDAHQADRDC